MTGLQGNHVGEMYCQFVRSNRLFPGAGTAEIQVDLSPGQIFFQFFPLRFQQGEETIFVGSKTAVGTNPDRIIIGIDFAVIVCVEIGIRLDRNRLPSCFGKCKGFFADRTGFFDLVQGCSHRNPSSYFQARPDAATMLAISAASSGVSSPPDRRQFQLPPVVDGRFMRAPVSRPSQSCNGMTVTRA